jgi:hypothetical protein
MKVRTCVYALTERTTDAAGSRSSRRDVRHHRRAQVRHICSYHG